MPSSLLQPARDAGILCRQCPLFIGVSPRFLEAFLIKAGYESCFFPAGEEIPTANRSQHLLGILLSGLAIAYAPDPGKSVILRTIPPGNPFGIAVLFAKESPVSLLRAKKDSEVLFLTPGTVKALLTESPEFLENYILFLSGRIRFLSRRIACYTAGSAERKLACYLLSLPPSETDPETVLLDVSMTELSDLLDLGRASLYRAFDRLTSDRLIFRNDRSVRIPDRNALSDYGLPQEPSLPENPEDKKGLPL